MQPVTDGLVMNGATSLEPGRDRFHSVPDFSDKDGDAVELQTHRVDAGGRDAFLSPSPRPANPKKELTPRMTARAASFHFDIRFAVGYGRGVSDLTRLLDQVQQ